MKRMMHPQHGWTHACNANEEKYLRERGWDDEKINAAPQVTQEEVLSPGSPPAPDGAAPVKRKPGRPPKPKA
jgi:hypothetical protein